MSGDAHLIKVPPTASLKWREVGPPQVHVREAPRPDGGEQRPDTILAHGEPQGPGAWAGQASLGPPLADPKRVGYVPSISQFRHLVVLCQFIWFRKYERRTGT